MSEVDELNKERENLNNLIRLRNLVLKLEENPEFKEVILEGFCLKDCANYLRNSTNTCLSDKARENSLEMARASGHLLNYLEVIKIQGDNAENQLIRLETAYDEE